MNKDNQMQAIEWLRDWSKWLITINFVAATGCTLVAKGGAKGLTLFLLVLAVGAFTVSVIFAALLIRASASVIERLSYGATESNAVSVFDFLTCRGVSIRRLADLQFGFRVLGATFFVSWLLVKAWSDGDRPRTDLRAAVPVTHEQFNYHQGKPLKIVIAGDGRAEYPWNPHRSCDHDGMNEVVTRAISKAVLDEEASILLWTGDIVNVNDKNPDTLKNGLEKWREIMAPLYSNKVKVWPVRGNHEVYRYPDRNNYDGELMRDSAAVWKETFPELPQNDPKSDDGLSFYSVEGSTLIIGLDQYGGAEDDPLQRKHLVNQKWLDQVLSQNQKPFTLVYGHEAAFMAGRHNDDDTLAANASARNSFVQSLLNAKAFYFCGHDHFYDHMRVVRSSSPSAAEFLQITAGTAGAPFYPAGQYAGSALWKQKRVVHIDNVYGYILVVVDEKLATITFKGAVPYGCDKGDEFTFAAMDQMAFSSAPHTETLSRR